MARLDRVNREQPRSSAPVQRLCLLKELIKLRCLPHNLGCFSLFPRFPRLSNFLVLLRIAVCVAEKVAVRGVSLWETPALFCSLLTGRETDLALCPQTPFSPSFLPPQLLPLLLLLDNPSV